MQIAMYKNHHSSGNSSVIKTIETSAHRILIAGDGIIRVFVLPEKVGFDQMQELLDQLKILAENEKIKLFVDPSEIKGIDPKARKHFGKELEKIVSKCGLILRNKIVQSIVSLILTIDKPKFEMKTFNNEEDAIKWLLDD